MRLQEVFESNIAPVGDCVEWTGRIGTHGYGLLYDEVDYYAHRVSWFLHTGKWPEKKMMVCHHCDNKKCVKFEHLFLGTNLSNMRDAAKKNRMGRPHTLSAEKRAQIKYILETNTMSQRAIAARFGTTQSTVSEINRGLHVHTGRKQDA